MKHEDRSRARNGRSRARRVAVSTALGVGLLAITFGSGAAASVSNATTATTVTTEKTSKGTVLAAEGATLYTVKTKKACDAKCHKSWTPALLPTGVTKATASGGVDASQLGTVSSEGGLQITYSGKPLFWYAKDKAGTVKGNLSDKWGKWAAVVTKASANSGGSGGSSGGGSGGNSDAGTGGIAF